MCIPIIEDQGINSKISGHFGSAPFSLVVDTESERCYSIANRNQHHDHGMCQPLATLRGESLDALAVAGIGTGALEKLQLARIQVFRTRHTTAAETLAAFKGGQLELITPGAACHNHGGMRDAALP